jgi:hypothetical protein
MIGPKLTHNRTQRPSWWLEGARKHWELRCQYRVPPDLPPLEAIVQEPSDVAPFLALVREQKKPIPQIYLDTRPPYMSREAPQAEPCHTGYLSLFERIIESAEPIATLTPQEVDELLGPFQDLLQFSAVTQLIKRRWDYERERIYTRRRAKFRQLLHDTIIGEAMHPRRVERILEQHGFEGLIAAFGE